MTGQEINLDEVKIGIELIKPDKREEWLGELLGEKPYISVDFSHPSAVNENARFYCKNDMPFVMGTTGGDRDALVEEVLNSETSAVIAPNMAKPIVLLQSMMQYASENYPGALGNFELKVKESHQKGKADTSGTAKAMIKYFNKLGMPFTPEEIVKVRDPEEQLRMGVPEEYLKGHGWHTYKLDSKDETVHLELTHNVNGRDVYALGALDAIRYLHKKLEEGSKGQVFTMIDVLKG